MNFFIELMTVAILSINFLTPATDHKPISRPQNIDALILAYDAMYNADEHFKSDYLILDMESIDFSETTPEDRTEMIEYFKKYNKPVVSASLFRLKEMGLADKVGNLKIKGVILMFKCIKSSDIDNGIDIEGIKYAGPVGADFYKLHLVIENGKWVLKSIELTGIA